MENYAFITGSSDRIGKAIALDLAKHGNNLLLHYNNSEEKALKVKSLVDEFNVKSELVHFNFLEENDYDEFFSSLKKRNISVQILVNCASDFRPSSFDEKGSELLRKEIRINFENAYLLTKSFARYYDKGHIINFLDTKIKKNHSPHLDYILSKKLFRDFTELAAVELAPRFRVNAIAPGLVLPPAGKNEEYLLKLAENIPMKSIGNLEEILKAFRFLIDSQFITGQTIYVDGGDHLI